MNKQTGIIAGAVVATIFLVGGVAIAVSGGDDADEATDTTTTTTSTTAAPSEGGSSGGGSPSGGGSGGGAPSNEQPYFQPDHSIEAFLEDNKPYVRVDLHAYDPDGPEEEEVLEVQFVWGDGNQTNIPGSQGSNNAFSSTHEYDTSYCGQSVHVVVRAVDADGGSAQFEGDPTLPAC